MPNSTLEKTRFHLHNLWWLLLAAVSIVLDQYTKHLASTKLIFAEPVPVLPFLNWTLLHNYGAAFSFLADKGGWQKWLFSGLALAVSLSIMAYLRKIPQQAKLLALGLSLVMAGALGNLIDRVRLGYVIDFLHVHYGDAWHFPIFNMADVAINIGVALILIDAFLLESKRNTL